MKRLQVKGQDVLLLNDGGRFYALSNACTHVGFPLSHGLFYDGTVTCAYHGAQFDVATGRVLSPPARANLISYEVRVEGEDVLVRV
jgi:nitrite reductase/ring-hydroxylating ferredoxin subunit